MRIRPYDPADGPTLTTLFRDTVRRVDSRDYSPEQIRAWAPDEFPPEWARKFAERFTLVAEADGQVVGFGELDPDGHINRFYVHADCQGRGVGRALLAALEAEAARRGLHRLYTEASITARPFFERLGFATLAAQEVECRGEQFVNFRMEKGLARDPR